MDGQAKGNPSSQFLKTDGGKTKSNAIEVPSISLPKGGGAIKGIDEKFAVNSVNGTASFSIPLPFSPARGASPALSLSYNSGAGNGSFGLGWSLSLGSIKRKTDKGLPQYHDGMDSDTFLFSEAEDLVPEFKKELNGSFSKDTNGEYVIHGIDSPDGNHIIRFYKPRVEGLFARIERWTEKTSGRIKWRILTRDNVTTLFGWTSNAVIADPGDNRKIFEWLPEFVFDDKGNCSHYLYKKEDSKGFNASLPHNRNRFQNGKITYTNLYLEKVLYGNKKPYANFGTAFPAETDYMFQTVLDYGEYDTEVPIAKIRDWEYRPDAFSDYKPGFEIRTTRLCKRVLLFHFFEELPGGSALVKSTNFEYDTTSEKDFTFLKTLTVQGYIKKTDGSYTNKKMPPVEFTYQKHHWNTVVKTISSEDLVHAPAGLDEQNYQFTDLFNEGLSGILTEQTNGWYYKHNLGKGNFALARLVSPKPSFAGLGNRLQLADLDADGGKQLVSFSTEPRGYFELDDKNEWQSFKNFKTLPNIDFGDANTRMLDLNGDGQAEILITEEAVFTWYGSQGRNGFSESHKTLQSSDEEAGPQVVFADAAQSIFLADMSGDGMTDIVRIRNGEICYWPNLGYGNFGAKVTMDDAPVFDHPESFDPSYLRLADIDGSGTTDIIYLGKNTFSCWMNLSGNRFSPNPFEIKAFPDVHKQTRITVADLLGNGVACIVWSSGLSKDAGSPLRYIDLMGSTKPHIMIGYKNNLGKEVSLTYKPSTTFYLEDKLEGNPWVTKLHFPVHCISETVTLDKITGWRFVSSYKYHHGYYDHPEREFRGFGMVEQTDTEHFEHWEKGNATNIVDRELHQEPVISKTWFHTGAFLQKDKILNQFAHEYWYTKVKNVTHPDEPLPDAQIIPAPGISTDLIEQLGTQEWREALRACKGMALRSEIFAQDAPLENPSDAELIKQGLPYSVGTHNCVIELLQPKGRNKHAVYVVKESEAITYSYDRNPEDPRIAHNLNIKLDEYGNVLESAAVVYPRKEANVVAETILPPVTQDAQRKTVILYTQNQFTNDVMFDHVYRLRLPSEVKTYELKGVPKTASFYGIKDFDTILTSATEVAYHDIDTSPSAGSSQKRLIEHFRSTYYNNELKKALPLHQLDSLALPYESYQLAYTPELVSDIYGTRVTDALLTEGKFTHSEGDSNWWIRSGTTQFITGPETVADAQKRFYVPISYTDPYGSITKVGYYKEYYLFIDETEDELNNRSRVDLFNFRTLSPQRMRDINNNLSEVLADELGLVKAMAVLGKGSEADDLSGFTEYTSAAEAASIDSFFNTDDSVQLTTQGKELLKHATARFIYDFDVFLNTGKPAVEASIVREENFQKNNDSPIQLSFEYSNGLGTVVMKKAQAEPGLAKEVQVHPDDTYTIVETDTSKRLRWIGNGRTILNNKGNAVKQYEPYFSVSPYYEDLKELVETGVTPFLYYDALGRLIKTEMPDGTFSMVEFDSWKQKAYDANDTVLESAWYSKRMALPLNDREKKAAEKASKHANTPNVLHFDTLGRPVLSIEHNKNLETDADEFYKTKIKLDTEGNLRTVTDARELPENGHKGNTVMQYKYDMLGNLVYQNSMDAGQSWLLVNILGNPLRTWDERDHEFQYFYDQLHRPTQSKVLGGDGTPLNHIFDRLFYGEADTNPEAKNLRGQVIKHYDTGGLLESPEYDFKGQPLATTRRLFSNYKEVAHWADTNLLTDLENEAFIVTTETDALGRITKQITPDGSVITPSYNEAGLLNEETVSHSNPALTTTYIKDIDYNEKGQRSKIIYGNNVTTKFHYDTLTFRLIRQETFRQNIEVLQDLYYTFDPVGNITHLEDKAIPISFFANAMIEPISEYSYDALYRLRDATGRENNATLTFDHKDNWNDAPFMQQHQPGDPMTVRNYMQKYGYDEVGNITQMAHKATDNDWTRIYKYETANNRLLSTKIGNQTYEYPHNPQHGFITIMPHLDEMGWNFKEELVKTIRQKVNAGNGIPETTWYQYDGQGQRIRKITENSSSVGAIPTRKDERIYIAGYETYRTYQANTLDFERETLSLLDEGHRFVMIETVKQNTNTTPPLWEGVGKRFVRYQLHNHLGSAVLELDVTAQVISYEEYHPYGTTSYQSMNTSIKAAAKRYRYTGMERDEETGLEYHSARYYLSWLGRWLNADPLGTEDGDNLFSYVGDNPFIFHDLFGGQRESFEERMARNGGNVLLLNASTVTNEGLAGIDQGLSRIQVKQSIGKIEDTLEHREQSDPFSIPPVPLVLPLGINFYNAALTGFLEGADMAYWGSLNPSQFGKNNVFLGGKSHIAYYLGKFEWIARWSSQSKFPAPNTAVGELKNAGAAFNVLGIGLSAWSFSASMNDEQRGQALYDISASTVGFLGPLGRAYSAGYSLSQVGDKGVELASQTVLGEDYSPSSLIAQDVIPFLELTFTSQDWYVEGGKKVIPYRQTLGWKLGWWLTPD